MANGTSTLRTALDAAQTTRNGAVSFDGVQATRRVYRDSVVGLGNHSNNEYFDLMGLGLPGARIVPEECRLRFSGSGTVDFKARLQKVASDGTATNLSAATPTISALTAAIAIASTDGGPLPLIEPTDRLRLLLLTGASAVTIPDTATIHIEVAYDVAGR